MVYMFIMSSMCSLLFDTIQNSFMLYFQGLYYTPLPMLLFGVVAIIAGLLALKLPETFGIKLPETVEEAKNIKNAQYM